MIDYEVELFEKIHLFRGLSHEELSTIREKLSMRRLKKNEIILREEDANKFMYIILRGRVKVIQTTEEGREIVLSIHGAGDTFGEVSLIDGKTAQARVVAVADSLIAIISKEDFYELYHSHSKVMDNLLMLFCARFRESIDNIKMLNLNNADQRMQMLFIKLMHHYGDPDAGGMALKIKLTHSDLANMSGLTRETVTRIMNKWQKDGLIEVKNRIIRLKPDFVKELS
jgi:CRP/FNR family cyclic AMP-dependent transcriptional regulator